jgi:NAD(P)H-nitrite reductase large subunit
MQTSAEGIYAAGDVAEHDGGVTTELWHAAEYQGEVAALNAIGKVTPFDNPPFRLKCEVFGSYFFSVGKPQNSLDYAIEEHERGSMYQSFYFNADDQLVGVVMVNDRDHAKEYEQAVRERWDRKRVEAGFPLV